MPLICGHCGEPAKAEELFDEEYVYLCWDCADAFLAEDVTPSGGDEVCLTSLI